LTVTDGDVSYGDLSLNATTTSIVKDESQVVENTGNVTENINIKSTDAVGTTTWALAASTGNLNEYVHKFSTTTGSSWTTFNTSHEYSTLKTGLAENATTSLDVYIQVPTSSGDYQEGQESMWSYVSQNGLL
jgi:hypothetical protein